MAIFPFDDFLFSNQRSPGPKPQFGNPVRISPSNFSRPQSGLFDEPGFGNRLDTSRFAFDEPGGRGFPAESFFQQGAAQQPFGGRDSPFGVENISSELLNDPDRTFFGALDRADLTPNQRTFFETQQDEFLNRFKGKQDTALRANPDQTSEQTFGGFLENFDFGREFNRRPPGQRFGASNLNRAVRHF